MSGQGKRVPKRRSVEARGLLTPRYRQRIIRQRKGKGSYSRKRRV